MISYELDSVPNQTFSISTPDGYFNFELRYFRDLMYVTITDTQDNIIVSNLRCAPYQWIMPFTSLAHSGNFRFEPMGKKHYPNYSDFGTSCPLVYYTKAEIIVKLYGDNNE